jgi:hypothetical protein
MIWQRRHLLTFSAGKQTLGAVQRQALEKILWRDARPPGEVPVKVVRTQSHLRRQLAQIRLLGEILIEIGDHAGNFLIVVDVVK